MQRPAKKLEPYSMEFATTMAKSQANDVLARASGLTNDSEKPKRLAGCTCKTCFYLAGRMAGQAITEQPCGGCGKSQVYSSTYTDALCLDCAKQHKLCKHCGGDLEMRARRKWPDFSALPEA